MNEAQEVDPDREVEELIRYSISAGRQVARRIEAAGNLRPAQSFDEAYGASWLRAGEIARSTSTAPDPVAKDLVAWGAFFSARRRSVEAPADAALPGAPAANKAAKLAIGTTLLRRAYRAQTGHSVVTGRLSDAERQRRRETLPAGFEQEGLALASRDYADSESAGRIRRMISTVSGVVEARNTPQPRRAQQRCI